MKPQSILRTVLPFLLGGPALAQILMIDLASQPIGLQPNTAGQQVGIYINNQGLDAVLANAATLKFQLDDGLNGGNAPSITAIDAVTGTPWAVAGGVQITQTSQAEYWDVRVFSNFLGGQHASLPVGSSLFATLTFDTTGLSSGSWSFATSAPDVDLVGSKYELTTGATYIPNVTFGSVSITPVPEPESLACLTVVGLAGMAVWRRLRSGPVAAAVRPR